MLVVRKPQSNSIIYKLNSAAVIEFIIPFPFYGMSCIHYRVCYPERVQGFGNRSIPPDTPRI